MVPRVPWPRGFGNSSTEGALVVTSLTIMPIRLDEIRLTHVRVPLHEPFVISSGSVAEKDAILIELLGEGLVGLGEASPMAGSFYSHHTPDGCWDDLVGRVIPMLQRAGAITPRAFLAASESIDDPFARCGVETAMWDILARAQGRPLWQVLGGSAAATVESGLAVGIFGSVSELVERIGRYLERDGYRRVKIKVEPGWDVEPLQAVREAWPQMPLMVDANASYRREHIEHIASWDRFGLMMIEQPLPGGDLEGHALLASRCRTPICLDESATSARVVSEAIDRGAARIVNIKLQRVGGFTGALDIHNTARTAGVGCWIGTMPELAVGGWGAVHMATLPNVRYPTDVESSDRWFVTDITAPTIRCQGGTIRLPTGAGLGVSLDTDVIARFAGRRHCAPLRLALSPAPVT